MIVDDGNFSIQRVSKLLVPFKWKRKVYSPTLYNLASERLMEIMLTQHSDSKFVQNVMKVKATGFFNLQVSPSFTPGKSFELLHRMTGKGLGVTYKFTRSPCIYSTSMVSVEVVLTNTTDAPISNIHIGEKVSYILHSHKERTSFKSFKFADLCRHHCLHSASLAYNLSRRKNKDKQ